MLIRTVYGKPMTAVINCNTSRWTQWYCALCALICSKPRRSRARDRCSLISLAAATDRPLSNMAMSAVLARMDHDDLTVHGFRATFRTWAAECTSSAREIAEAVLAHGRGQSRRVQMQILYCWGDEPPDTRARDQLLSCQIRHKTSRSDISSRPSRP